MDKNYFELRLKINPDMEDLISEIFFDNFDCEGVVLAEETYKDLEMVSTTEGTLKIFLKDDDSTTFEDMEYDVENVLDLYREEFLSRGLTDEELGSWDFELEEKKSEDWSQKWKEKWDVTHVTDKIAVVPDWIDYVPKKGEVIIKLEPGCAFGTGTHQTTQLCMKALEKYMKPNDKVADIGMGSGILSILAKKLGASYVYGCDTDDTVIEVAKENAKKNGVDAIFELGTADKVNEKFDFVCANILHFVLAEIMGDLKNLMKKGAIMSLSGILDEKKQMVIDAYEKENLELVEEIHQDQWTSFVVKRID
ncbi:TPA: 50S ribosomal protein L11 methyltransferase [Candidatus Gastranaerophilales bacterium HUM_6]|nr:ribosomal protein L11 methyltransferase [Fusobacterium sp. CAG:815]DAA93358.1 MAG TPA: 50S ribosomal protein L11 methyltransferase [Candidatus Gastranaerophilales bacterium HUM_6]DAA96151.1 MAG TPA: 50S ribosomal protein L11 methyltransferase [Candidatus Gastranaerophilales bacterium HUM_7]DAB03113.1 MAG TPA: 50S ribosomal protein L11 methyltransferase [Candidatus Gastranaerophilales bacterium HUM_12]DAB08049.1 MAG TPA: 50S ribosomal protein L11 methyltransferase [Candidatus Gastranaerophila